MQPNPWLTLGALCLFASPATAQAVHCDDLKADRPGDAVRAFECLEIAQSDLIAASARIDTLEDRLDDLESLAGRVDALTNSVTTAAATTVPAVGDHPETRAVVAYVSAKGEKTCPKGWVPFEAAKDRFILGAGANYPVVGTTDGEAEVTLSEAQMPTHDHDFAYVSVRGIEWLNAGTNTNMPYFNISSSQSARNVNVKRHGAGVFSAGGGEPHNNMPPFIALYFCQSAG